MNLYGFAGGDPVNHADPFGLSPDTLSGAERSSLGNTCSQVDCDQVQVHRGDDNAARNTVRDAVLKISGNRAVTLGFDIYLPDDQAHDLPTLAHEVTHVGQFQAWGGLGYYKAAIGDRRAELGGGNPYALPSPLPGNRSFRSYGMEQQGQIVQNCFAGLGGCKVSPYRP